jgi:hypothetical protein
MVNESVLLRRQERRAAKLRVRMREEKKIVARFEELRKIYGSTDATIQLANELYVSVPTIYNIRRRVEKYQKMESNGNQ